MRIGYDTLDDVMIRQFINDPEFADFHLSEVLKNGDPDEIAEVQYWYNEAKARTLDFALQA